MMVFERFKDLKVSTSEKSNGEKGTHDDANLPKVR
jgi:hypothetical protein